jgi:hypothetical protein
LMHHAALLSEAREDQKIHGWDIDTKQEFKWNSLV